MDKLWMKMTRIYGHKWSSIAESDDGTWVAGLRGITPDQVAAALGRLVTMAREWPPTLPEFRKLCLAVDDEELDGFIRKFALKRFQSFDIHQMSRHEVQKHIDRAREAATDEYLHKKMIFSLHKNNLLTSWEDCAFKPKELEGV